MQQIPNMLTWFSATFLKLLISSSIFCVESLEWCKLASLFQILVGKPLAFHPKVLFGYVFAINSFMILRYVPSKLTLVRIFIMNGCGILPNVFILYLLRWSFFLSSSSSSFLVLMWCITQIDLHLWNHLCDPGINPTWIC